jgi:hypothetical protein
MSVGQSERETRNRLNAALAKKLRSVWSTSIEFPRPPKSCGRCSPPTTF